MELNAIVAVYTDWGIGYNGTQPVVLQADRKHFREMTDGAAVIVGYRTLQDFPGVKPLPNRTNIVLSSHDIDVPGAIIVCSIDAALQAAQQFEKVFVIGGATVYKALLPYCKYVFATLVHETPASDSYFPDLNCDPNWKLIDQGTPLWENNVLYQFMTYKKYESRDTQANKIQV